MTIDDAEVEFYVDSNGQECYVVSLNGRSSIVSSAHLVEERKVQLLRQEQNKSFSLE